MMLEPPRLWCAAAEQMLFVEKHHAEYGEDDCEERTEGDKYAFIEGAPVAARLHTVFRADVGLVGCGVIH